LTVKRLLWMAVVLLGLLAGTAAAAVPVGTARDAAATKAFIRLQDRYDLAAIRAAPGVRAAQDAVVARARSECPSVLRDAPRRANAHQFGPMLEFYTEALLTLNVEQLAPLRALSHRIGDQQQRLRFSDPALQWQVHVEGSALGAYVDLRPPDLCAGARVLAASHFTKLTAAGTRFVQDASTLFPLAAAPPTRLARLMRPYAPEAVSAALKRLPQRQQTLDRRLAFGAHLHALLRALGAPALGSASAPGGAAS
jgi:hypothetical protein